MTIVKENYPWGMNDEEIEECIKDYTGAIKRHAAGLNAVLQYSPLIQLGVTELQRRQNQHQVKENKKVTRLSLRIAVLSAFVSIGSLLLAGSALYISYNTSTRWEKNQLDSLGELKTEIRMLSSNLEEVIKESGDKNIGAIVRSTESLSSVLTNNTEASNARKNGK